LANAHAVLLNKPASKIILQLRHREQQKALSQKLKTIFGNKRAGVTMVETPSEDGTWELQTERESIETGCIEENIRRFTQANQTPSSTSSGHTRMDW
jgi:hypothetical protein